MASIKTGIQLFDGASAILDRITGKNNKMISSFERAQETVNKGNEISNKLSLTEQKLEILGQQYVQQTKVVKRLQNEYQNMAQTYGRGAVKVEELKNKLLSAQMAEVKLAESVEKAGEALRAQEQAEQNLGKGIENAAQKQRIFNRELNAGTNVAGNLLRNIKRFIGAYIGIRGIKKGLQATVGEAAKLTEHMKVLQAAFGNLDIGRHYFNKLRLYALETGYGIDELTEATRNFTQVTRNTQHLAGLTEIARKLTTRTGSLSRSEAMIQEALAGRVNRGLKRALHLSDAQIAPLEQAIQKGSMNGIINAFNQAFKTAGITDEIVQAYEQSPVRKFYRIFDRIKFLAAEAGQKTLEMLEPVFDKINTWLKSDSVNAFFGAISWSISTVASGLLWITELIADNWNIIQPILITLTTVILVDLIAKLWATIPPLMAHAAAWLAAHWPILLVTGAIVTFVKILNYAGVSAAQITGFIGGVFGVLWANIYNGVAFTWNTFVAFAEFIRNVFIDPVYAIKMLFYNLATEVLNYFNQLIQGVANGLNWIVGKVNKVLGTNIGTIQVEFMDNLITGLEKHRPTTNKDVWEAPRMEYKNYAAEATKWYSKGFKLPGQITGGIKSIEEAINNFGKQEDVWNKAQKDMLYPLGGDLDKLNDTGKKIKESVDKSNEELKWMRDIAEQEVINRFTTATMAPQIEIKFGDVKETADVDGIVDHIENIMTEQLNIAAEGVHE